MDKFSYGFNLYPVFVWVWVVMVCVCEGVVFVWATLHSSLFCLLFLSKVPVKGNKNKQKSPNEGSFYTQVKNDNKKLEDKHLETCLIYRYVNSQIWWHCTQQQHPHTHTHDDNAVLTLQKKDGQLWVLISNLKNLTLPRHTHHTKN